MKKLLLFCLLLVSVAELHASLRQTKYRWRNDDGNETTATWMAPQNTPVTILSTTTSVRLRLEFDNDNGAAFSSVLSENLQYSIDGITWTTINGAPTNAFAYTTSTFVNNGAATTLQMPPGTAGTFVPGRIVTTPSLTPMSLNDGEKTEMEWVIKPTANAVPGQTYFFQTADQEDLPLELGELTISPQCAGTPTAGNLAAAMPVVECNQTTMMTITGSTIGLGINYQWQYGLNGVWTDFGGNASTQASQPVIQNLQYRCVVTCANSGEKDTTNVIAVNVLPLPVDLGNDINECVDTGAQLVLDAGVLPHSPQYVWDNGSISQVRGVKESGTYYVKVTNEFTCVGFDTINVILRDNPIVNLGNDTSICNGASLTLNGGPDGISYFWNTGATTQLLTVSGAGAYAVFVTNNLGCIKSDTIQVNTAGELPHVDGINISNNGINTFKFTAVNPQNVIGYIWDFGDGSPPSYQQSPTHSYDVNPASYIVVLKLSSSCGFLVDSTSANIVGIKPLTVSNDELSVYPNPAKTSATILNKGSLKMEHIAVYNVLGQLVYQAAADSKDKHMLSLGGFAGGLYTIEINTDKGRVARKLEIQR
ncbi:T9SS type A sorting domain-containing protein [Taibaiella koreensis]|uniref:T9SS type A sorting domain-containing protein n=1 Tax=Taibaiella koreensis TaxID=1268548 RepID=UPI000E59958C|nr:T9SS type A sorting domain-containing protein [Taibaiella koreensis]